MKTNYLQTFKFIRGEEFFGDLDAWDTVTRVVSDHFESVDKTEHIELETTAEGLSNPILLLQFVSANTYRIRFNPGWDSVQEERMATSHAIVVENAGDLREFAEDFSVDRKVTDQSIVLTTTAKHGVPKMRLTISLDPYGITAESFENGSWITLLEDARPAIRFRKIEVATWDDHDWSVIFERRKFAFTKYIGFGEKGGGKLCQNGSQLTYFNFDNMRYRQVYGQGPMESREPLYDTNPFFMEFAAEPCSKSVASTFIDNTSQLCLDIGFLHSDRILLGSLFDGMDLYQTIAPSCREAFRPLGRLIGTPRLKPRFMLGYHQGCYGYENRDTLLEVVRAFRDNHFPLDGLHIDVDMQDQYRTFTIDEQKFPDPKGMFRELRELGVKCSTNITPVISNKSLDYQTYREGKELDYFINDHRALPHADQRESHQDFSDGHEVHWDNYNPRINSGEPFEGEVYYGGDRGTPGHYPDFGRQDVRAWWGRQYKFLFDMGLEFVWQDMTSPCIRSTRGDMRSLPFDLLLTDDSIQKFEPDGTTLEEANKTHLYPKHPFITIQSLFSYNLHKATYMGLNALESRKGLRNFIIGRGGYAGTQRYAALWTGDNASDWDFYRINVAQALGLGMSGQAISGEDIGGFESHNGESWCDPELFIRWMTAGAFLPWFRNHYMAKGVKEFQEPYRFSSVVDRVAPEERYLYESVLPVTRYYVELRYRLLQLFYDAMFENSFNGMPIVRPLFLHDDDLALFADKLAYLDDEFLVGKDLLVAPVIYPSSRSKGQRLVYLPAGSEWYRFMNALKPVSLPIAGGATVRADASINADPDHVPFILPMFVRAGAILPIIELEQFVGERHSRGQINPVTLYIYPGVSGQYTMYLDDGVSRASAMSKDIDLGGDEEANDEYQEVRISHRFASHGKRVIEVEIGQNGYTPREDFFFVAVVHDPRETRGTEGPLQEISVGGSALALLEGGTIANRSRELWVSEENGYYYHEAVNITYIKLFYRHASVRLDLSYL